MSTERGTQSGFGKKGRLFRENDIKAKEKPGEMGLDVEGREKYRAKSCNWAADLRQKKTTSWSGKILFDLLRRRARRAK